MKISLSLVACVVPRGEPQNFTAIGVSSTSVRLEWDPPDPRLRNGDIIMYEIMYYKTQDHVDVYGVNTTETSLIIEGLAMNTDYVFMIKGYTSKGAGPWSNHLPFRTFGRCKYTAALNVYVSICYILVTYSNARRW